MFIYYDFTMYKVCNILEFKYIQVLIAWSEEHAL